ncbi:hypothetical protein ACPPVW_18680 [Leifsonia sp. McL0607]|uniref:hypothetical protein n=1 Tax=Leifsonia sp. McL0607 TaxID=3415672 RepID=UPI003CECB2FA
MTAVLVSLTIRQAQELSARTGDMIVTPRTLDRLRGHVVDGVAFHRSASELNVTERVFVAEAIASASAPDLWGERVRIRLDRWVDGFYDETADTAVTPVLGAADA